MEKRFAYRMRATVVHEPEFYTWGGEYKHANIESNNTILLCIRQHVL